MSTNQPGDARPAGPLPEEALPRLLSAVEAGGEQREKARLQMIDVFDRLGPEHEPPREYRRRLACALF